MKTLLATIAVLIMKMLPLHCACGKENNTTHFIRCQLYANKARKLTKFMLYHFVFQKAPWAQVPEELLNVYEGNKLLQK